MYLKKIETCRMQFENIPAFQDLCISYKQKAMGFYDYGNYIEWHIH